MPIKKGKLIVFEGIDGSGKQTQSKNLYNALSAAGYKVMILHFPSYSETFFGKEVANYLNGKFGQLNEIDPKLVAMLYSGDRYEKKNILNNFLNHERNILICDRYVPSNIAHQAAKLNRSGFDDFKNWVEQMEYEIYKLPRPDLVILLDLLPELSSRLVLKKERRNYTDKKQDLHEENKAYLRTVYETYQLLANSKDWIKISCFTDEQKIRSIDEISGDVYQAVLKHLNF